MEEQQTKRRDARILMPEAKLEIPFLPIWCVEYFGSNPDGSYVGRLTASKMTEEILNKPDTNKMGSCQNWMEMETQHILPQIAAISHPLNYRVQVTPKLTPKEQNKLPKQGRPFRKKPHFIIVDHEVLVRMKGGEEATQEERNSPVPHHRRGHWRRLSERCRHAKLLGQERTWIRPSFIGDPKFEDERNLYEVIL